MIPTSYITKSDVAHAGHDACMRLYSLNEKPSLIDQSHNSHLTVCQREGSNLYYNMSFGADIQIIWK